MRLRLPASQAGEKRRVINACAEGDSEHNAVISLVTSTGAVLQYSIPAAESESPVRIQSEYSLAALAGSHSQIPLAKLLVAESAVPGSADASSEASG